MMIAFSLILFLLVLILFLFIISGLNISLSGWDRQQGERIRMTARNELSELFDREKVLTGETIAETLNPYLEPSIYLYVYDAAETLLFSYRLGIRWYTQLDELRNDYDGSRRSGGNGPAGSGPGAGRNFLARHIKDTEPVPIIHAGEPRYFIVAGSEGFTETSSNRRFLDSIILTIIIGTSVSLIAALIASYLFSRGLAKQASLLAAGLRSIRQGRRNVFFEHTGSRELKEISEGVTALQERLLQEENLRSQWAQDAAHDLRTPVSAVRSQLEAMIDGVLAADSARLAKVLSELNRVERLVEDLMSLTAIESPEMQPRLEPFYLSELNPVLADRFGPQAEKKSIAVELNIDSIYISADKALLLRAVSNIIDNAVKYAPRESRVIVSSRVEGEARLITVKNQGIINENDLPHIFDRLYRGETSRHSSGTGLGLTIARAVAEIHGGSLHAQNRDGSVEFVLSL